MRSGAPLEVIENLQEMEDEDEIYESIEDIWPDYPSKEVFFLQRGRILRKCILPFLFYISAKIILVGIFFYLLLLLEK